MLSRIKLSPPIGSSKAQNIDVKIISASNRDFTKMMDSKEFRNDLYFRLNAFNIYLPALRKRREDIDELTHFFIEYFSKEFKKPTPNISLETIDLLKTHEWPGNIRELRNVIERAVLGCQTDEIHIEDLPDTLGNGSVRKDKPLGKTDLDLEIKQRQLILQALQKTQGNQVQAAKLLNISRNTLRYRLKKYDI